MKLVGIIGYPLGHTISPLFQQAALDHLGLEVRYEAWATPPEALREALERLRGQDYLGANITVPYKEAVLPWLDGLDGLARRIGAVNTIVNRGGRLIGHNTDAEGFLRALREDGGFDPKGKRAVLLGAGGAARAVAFALAGAGASSIAVVNRTVGRAEALASALSALQLKVEALPWEQMPRALEGCHLIVNCTSLGMKHSSTERESPLPARLIPREALVYDIVYNPVNTPFLVEAQRAGARTLGGLGMLVYQGAASFQLWTGREAPVDIMLQTAKKALG